MIHTVIPITFLWGFVGHITWVPEMIEEGLYCSPQKIKWRDPHLAMKEHLHLSIGNLIGFSLFIAGITRQVLGSSWKHQTTRCCNEKANHWVRPGRTGHQSDIFCHDLLNANIPQLLHCDLSLHTETCFLRSFCPSWELQSLIHFSKSMPTPKL